MKQFVKFIIFARLTFVIDIVMDKMLWALIQYFPLFKHTSSGSTDQLLQSPSITMIHKASCSHSSRETSTVTFLNINRPWNTFNTDVTISPSCSSVSFLPWYLVPGTSLFTFQSLLFCFTGEKVWLFSMRQ